MKCGAWESTAETNPLCVREVGDGTFEFGYHIFMRDLFKPHTPAPEPNLIETSIEDAPVRSGLPGERFDLICADCGTGSLRLKKSIHGHFYGCTSWPDCPGTHGAHPDGRPKGIPGNKATRLARIEAHTVFDQLFKGPKPQMSVHEAYAWMAEEMKLTVEEAHIARFTIEQCNRLIRLVNVKLGPSAWTHISDDDPFDQTTEVIAEQEEDSGLCPDPDELTKEGVDYGTCYLMGNFVYECKMGFLSDDDGVGYFGTSTRISNRRAYCFELEHGSSGVPARFTCVWWFNK